MELSDLMRDEREIAVEMFTGETLNITYKPSRFTAAVEERFSNALDKKRLLTALAEALSEILIDWELGQNGERLPINLETMKALPGKALNDIYLAIVEDNRLGGKETRKNSGGGSLRAAK